MQTIYIPVGEGRAQLCDLLDKAEAGVRVVFTAHGKPKAELTAFREHEGLAITRAKKDLSEHLDALAEAGFSFEPSPASKTKVPPCRF